MPSQLRLGEPAMNLHDLHRSGLATSIAISEYYVKNFIQPLEVVRVLNAAGVRFMLVGLHGILGWMRKPRATQDVDVLVAARHHKKAVTALLAAFPHLEEYDLPVVTRLRDRDTKEVAIDVMKPNQQPFRDALKHTREVASAGLTYQIPSLEMALTMKFAPMISLHRQDEDKHLDAHDFINIVKSNPDIDLEKLAEFGELVYTGGGQEIVEKVKQIRAGEKLIL
jgi:hypothetical protein